MKNKLFLLGAFFGAFAFIFFFWQKSHNKAYIYPKKGNLTKVVEAIGRVSAKNIYKITPIYPTKIIKVFKDEGDFVKKGEVLAIGDNKSVALEMKKNSVAIEELKLEINATKKEIKALQINYQQTKKEFLRYKALFLHKVSSKELFEQKEALFKAAKARLKAKKLELKALEKRVNKLTLQGKILEKKYHDFIIKSPVDGVIVKKFATKGRVFLPQEKLFRIVNPKELWVEAYLDDKVAKDITPQMRAQIYLRSGKHYRGVVARIEKECNPITQERTFDVAFQKIPKKFFLNEQARVKIALKTIKDAWIVDVLALKYKRDTAGVIVENGFKKEFIKVKVLAINNNKAALSSKKLNKNSKILLDK